MRFKTYKVYKIEEVENQLCEKSKDFILFEYIGSKRWLLCY